jgi:adenylosuccinate synthase
MLPAGAFLPECNAYLGNAVYVNVHILHKELKLRQEIVGSKGGGVFLSNYAHVVTGDCLKRDEEKEAKQKMGSTKNGVSIAASDKYAYKGVTVKEWLAERPKWRKELESLGVDIVDPIDLFQNIVKPAGWNMVLEGTQGAGLDVNHGFQYPYVSSGSFTSFGLLDGVGYALAPDEICMVLKPYGSYFGPPRERGDFEDDDFRKFAGEFGTTMVRPSCIMLNCMDKLDYFSEHGKKWSLIIDDENKIDFEDKPMVDGKLTTAGALFVETIEEYTRAPVKFLGVGPKHDDIIER